MIPVLLFALPTLAAAAVVGPGPIHFPLSRRAHTDHDMRHWRHQADHIRAKYGFSTVQRRQSTSAIPLTNQHGDSSYLGPVSVGTPYNRAQPFTVILDTGSSDFWIASTSCTTCSPTTPMFDPTKSTTFKTTPGAGGQVDIQYGSGEVLGQLSQDTVSMGGFTVPAQTFLTVDQTSAQLLDGPVSGIMGLGFQTIASTRAVPMWEALLNNNQFSSPLFAFYLTRFNNDPAATDLEPGGVLTLGGTNSSLFTGDIEFINMPSDVPPSFWLLDMKAFTINGQSISISPDTSLSAIDTGTTLIGGPTDDVNKIWAAVPGAQALTGNNAGYFSFPCTTQFDVTISFGGKAWPISSDDMRLQTSEPGICVGSIFDLSLGSNAGGGGRGNPQWVVGDSFLKNVYSVYRATPPSVGFAQLSSSVGGTGISSSSSSSLAGPTSVVGTGTPTGRAHGTSTSNGPQGTQASGALRIHNSILAVVTPLFAGYLALLLV